MENYNVELNEWWELVETEFKEEMQKNMVAHRKDEEACRRYLFAYKKVFPTFVYCSLDISKPSNIIQKVKDIECNVTHTSHPQTPW